MAETVLKFQAGVRDLVGKELGLQANSWTSMGSAGAALDEGMQLRSHGA